MTRVNGILGQKLGYDKYLTSIPLSRSLPSKSAPLFEHVPCLSTVAELETLTGCSLQTLGYCRKSPTSCVWDCRVFPLTVPILHAALKPLTCPVLDPLVASLFDESIISVFNIIFESVLFRFDFVLFNIISFLELFYFNCKLLYFKKK